MMIIMLERDIKQTFHDGCCNRYHCKKDESQCMYLVKGHCLLDYDGDNDEQG